MKKKRLDIQIYLTDNEYIKLKTLLKKAPNRFLIDKFTDGIGSKLLDQINTQINNVTDTEV